MHVKKAIYAGTFDPLTKGHIDLIQRSLKIFDKLIIGVAFATPKVPLFTFDERVEILNDVLKDYDNIEIIGFEGLLVDFARKTNVNTLIRGLRAVSDFEYEFQMALMNRNLNKDVETFYLMPNEKYIYLSSSLIKHVIKLGGDVSKLLPETIINKVKNKLKL